MPSAKAAPRRAPRRPSLKRSHVNPSFDTVRSNDDLEYLDDELARAASSVDAARTRPRACERIAIYRS
jgi:hypothetical protein